MRSKSPKLEAKVFRWLPGPGIESPRLIPMPSPYLTKSDFKVAFDCATRLYYRKREYPTSGDDNEYLRFLADGGFMVEFIAKTRYAGGIDLVGERDPVRSHEVTAKELSRDTAILYEGAATVGKYHVRVDILEKKGAILNLIEVKSTSVGKREKGKPTHFLTKAGKVESRWKEYLLDVAFQKHVLSLAYPDLKVVPHLCIVNKMHRVREAESLGRFWLQKDELNPKSRPKVVYKGNLVDLRDSQLVAVFDVSREVKLLESEMVSRAEALAALIQPPNFLHPHEDITKKYKECRTCEFRVDGDRNGFAECWGKLANHPTHILDLSLVTLMGTPKDPGPVPALLRRGSASYLDLTQKDLGREGSRRDRRLMQWRSMKQGGVEVIEPALTRELSEHSKKPGYPLHFLDFEACDLALPHHQGLHPYERVAFQWSCHTISNEGKLTHGEWINTEREIPNFAFARALSDWIGNQGTIYVWSPYERATLATVVRQIKDWKRYAPKRALAASGFQSTSELDALSDWIDELLGKEDNKGKRRSSPRLRDLHELAKAHYFHPMMKGRTSIKVTLPAVWMTDEKVRSHPWFSQYLHEKDGVPLDPYKALQPLPFGNDDVDDDVVREGTGAIRVYQDLIFASGASLDDIAKRKQLLLQYCALDTAAMIMIWMHWTKRY